MKVSDVIAFLGWLLNTIMMKFTCIFFFLMALLACQRKTDQQSITAYPDTIYIDTNGNQYKFLGQIPDSLRTSEQSILISKLQDVVINDVSVKNNRMVVDISKEQMLAKGIPERYYYI